jgi:sensor histidine kinase YesM
MPGFAGSIFRHQLLYIDKPFCRIRHIAYFRCKNYSDLYNMSTAARKITYEALVLHAIFSLATMMLVISGIQYYYRFIFKQPFLTTFACLFLLACVYMGRWLCLTYFLRQKPFHFSLYSVLTLMAIIVLWPLIVKKIFHTPGEVREIAVTTLPFFIIGLVMGVFIKLIRASIQRQIQEARSNAEQKQSELNLLQSQLSPHFLFNTLNNMYGISITQHERVPALLLKLSDLLRYSVYDIKKPFVPLEDELEYINNYIDFEKLRISDRLILQTSIPTVIDPAITIAPMVLIVFIENAFKHAANSLNEKVYIEINLAISGNFIEFSVKNSFSDVKHESSMIRTSSGLGLSNTIRRLNLLYEGEHDLKQFTEDNRYIVQLRFKIKQQYV